MSFTDNKLEMSIVALSVVVVAGLGYLFKTPVQQALQAADIVYEMPRPKSFLAALFDLGGREVSRKYVNPFDKKKDDKNAVAKKDDKGIPKPAAAVAQKKAETKKKDDPTKKSSVEMQVVGADSAKHIGNDSGFGGGSGVGNQNDGGTNNKSADNSDDKKNKMTADQWRSLVLGQPTQGNVNKMVAAYMNKEISDSDFYGIVKELMHNSNPETQTLGLSAVSSFYNLNAFETTSSSYGSFPTEVQTKADAYLLGYANSGRLGILASALKSSSVETVSMATQIVVKGYQSAKSGVVAQTDPRNARGDVHTNSVSNYSQFVPIFQSLAQSTDQDVASMANSALSQIQSSVASL